MCAFQYIIPYIKSLPYTKQSDKPTWQKQKKLKISHYLVLINMHRTIYFVDLDKRLSTSRKMQLLHTFTRRNICWPLKKSFKLDSKKRVARDLARPNGIQENACFEIDRS